MKYTIKHSQFCILSSEAKFQKFLNSISPALHSELVSQQNKGCKAAAATMVNILNKIKILNKMNELVDFLLKEYPAVIISNDPEQAKGQLTVIIVQIKETEIFKHYNPDLLTFPQKLVMENPDSERLAQDVKYFISDKLGVDYIIVGNRAYIEYFKSKYKEEAQNFPKEDREIYKYKLKSK